MHATQATVSTSPWTCWKVMSTYRDAQMPAMIWEQAQGCWQMWHNPDGYLLESPDIMSIAIRVEARVWQHSYVLDCLSALAYIRLKAIPGKCRWTHLSPSHHYDLCILRLIQMFGKYYLRAARHCLSVRGKSAGL